MNTTGSLSHGDRHKIVRDLFGPHACIYWIDFGGSVLTGWVAFFVAVTVPGRSLKVIATVLAVVALYRAVLFTHELVHLGRHRLRSFRVAWDLLCGVPLLVPSFFYDGVHQEHHFRRIYGTDTDGEYLPFGTPPRSRIILYMISHLVLPPLMVLRFGLLGPLSWLSRGARHMVWEKMSSLSIDPMYKRTVPEHVPRSWIVQETLCAAYVWFIGILLYLGLLPLGFLATLYVISVLILTLNAIRTLAAHRYASNGEVMSFDEQLADSVNITAGWLTPLFAPVGLRYHGLHHLFPTMPYHNLGKAHRRLFSQLPNDAIYRSTLVRSVWQALREIWQASSNRSHQSSMHPV